MSGELARAPSRLFGKSRFDWRPHAWVLKGLGAKGGPLDGGYSQVSNHCIPAGYTYLAQFLAHDLTSWDRLTVSLHSVYGRGPDHDRYLYADPGLGYFRLGHRLRAGVDVRDVPRHADGRPSIKDSRNDLTILIGQVHASFLQVHNNLVTLLADESTASPFTAARETLSGFYRRVICHDVLPKLIDRTQLQRILSGNSLLRSTLRDLPSVPLEFSQAVAQFGHSMVRPRYRLNSEIDDLPILRMDTHEPMCDLRGQPLDKRASVEWSYFFPVDDPMDLQYAAKINGKVCRPLFEIPTRPGRSVSLPMRVLDASTQLGLPSGQDVAHRLGFDVVPEDVLWHGVARGPLPAPLWYYVLKEAEYQYHGHRLGELGGEIFGSVVEEALRRGEVAGQEHGVRSRAEKMDLGLFLKVARHGTLLEHFPRG